MSEELLNIAKELSEKPTTELALQFMELTADNIIKDKEIDRLNNILDELENIRKKAIEYIKNNLTIGSILDGKKNYCLNSYSFDYEDLLNILNKGSDKNE